MRDWRLAPPGQSQGRGMLQIFAGAKLHGGSLMEKCYCCGAPTETLLQRNANVFGLRYENEILGFKEHRECGVPFRRRRQSRRVLILNRAKSKGASHRGV